MNNNWTLWETFCKSAAIRWIAVDPKNVAHSCAVRPLKSLIIQAENDRGDIAEMLQGSLTGLGIKSTDGAFEALRERLVIVTESVNTGERFTEAMRHLIGKHKPDLVWLDPLLSFIGDDVSKQEVCSYFLRNLLNPISRERGLVWMMMHHTPKPPADPKAKSHWGTTDLSYAGTGSSELTNWARAMCLLRATKEEGKFQLVLAKRGRRAEATTLEQSRTCLLHLKHSEQGILWEKTLKPVVVELDKGKKKKKPEKTLQDLDGLISKVIWPMKKSAIVRLAIDGGHGSCLLYTSDAADE